MAKVMTENDDNKEDQFVIVENKDDLSPPGDDDDQEDARLGDAHELANGTDAEREAIRERRRQEKVERKDRRETAIKRDKIEREFLLKRNDELERRLQAQEQRSHFTELNALDAGIQEQLNIVRQADTVIAKAVEAGNGADMVQAQRYRDEAMSKANQLNFQKQQAAQRQVVQPTAGAPDQIALQYAQDFAKRNPWYDVRGQDEDSAIVLAVDAGLMRDGYRPDSEEYWAELDKRAARRLPERFKKQNGASDAGGDDDRTARGGPQIGSGREHAPSSTRKEIYISPARKQALIEANVWDDPVLRQKYVKRYAEYDRLNKN